DAPPIGMGNAPVLPKSPTQDPSFHPYQPSSQPAEPWPDYPAPAPNWTPPTPKPPPGPGSEVEEPDPTVVGDIKPMSVAPNQFAQVGAEMFSPRSMTDASPVLGAPARP